MHIMTDRGWQPLQLVKGTLTPPIYVKTLLEMDHIPLRSCANHYCEAIRRYLLGRDHPDFIDEVTMLRALSTK